MRFRRTIGPQMFYQCVFLLQVAHWHGGRPPIVRPVRVPGVPAEPVTWPPCRPPATCASSPGNRSKRSTSPTPFAGRTRRRLSRRRRRRSRSRCCCLRRRRRRCCRAGHNAPVSTRRTSHTHTAVTIHGTSSHRIFSPSSANTMFFYRWKDFLALKPMRLYDRKNHKTIFAHKSRFRGVWHGSSQRSCPSCFLDVSVSLVCVRPSFCPPQTLLRFSVGFLIPVHSGQFQSLSKSISKECFNVSAQSNDSVISGYLTEGDRPWIFGQKTKRTKDSIISIYV